MSYFNSNIDYFWNITTDLTTNRFIHYHVDHRLILLTSAVDSTSHVSRSRRPSRLNLNTIVNVNFIYYFLVKIKFSLFSLSPSWQICKSFIRARYLKHNIKFNFIWRSFTKYWLNMPFNIITPIVQRNGAWVDGNGAKRIYNCLQRRKSKVAF